MIVRAAIGAMLLSVSAQATFAQLSGRAASDGVPALGDDRTNLRDTSRPVHERGRTVHEGSAGRLSGNPVSGAGPIGAASPSLADVSQGAVTDRPDRSQANRVEVEPVGSADLERLTAIIKAVKPLSRQPPAAPEQGAP